tara:strand:+ start:11946 stop:12212 length:267 start_codon:yes stop_codon:yes gene_type:complete
MNKYKIIIPYNRETGGKQDAARIEKTKEMFTYYHFTNMYITFINKDMPTALTIEIFDNNKDIIKDVATIWRGRSFYIDKGTEIEFIKN